MDRQLAWGFVAATTLGIAAGIGFAPARARRELHRRAARRLALLERVASRAAKGGWKSIVAASALAGRVMDVVVEALRRPLEAMRSSPTVALKQSLLADPILKERDIWVDAHGTTILLHGVVEDDEEWRAADCLARMASPDGSVRNLLQVRRRNELT